MTLTQKLPDLSVEDEAALEHFVTKSTISECQPALYFQWDHDSVHRLVKGLQTNGLLETQDLPFDFHHSSTVFCKSVMTWMAKKLGTDHFKHILLTSKRLHHIVEIKGLLERLENFPVLQEAAHLYLPRKARRSEWTRLDRDLLSWPELLPA